jgi:predicted nucleotidyltransferase
MAPTEAQALADLIEQLRGTLPALLAGTPIEAAYLYGSMATGLATGSSDMDIGLLTSADLRPKARLQLELHLEQELAERCNLSNADVRILNGTPLRFQGRVLTEAVLLYSRNEERRVEWESRVRSAYFDFLPVIDHLQKEFFRKLKDEGLYGRSGQG